jgi:hypothetical protein
MDLSFTPGLPFTIGPTTMAQGYKLVSPRQSVTVVVWPATNAPDPDTGLSYFHMWAMYNDLTDLPRRKHLVPEVAASSVDGTKKPMRSDCIDMVLDHLYVHWRDLEWESREVKPLDYNIALYPSKRDWFEQAVLGR